MLADESLLFVECHTNRDRRTICDKKAIFQTNFFAFIFEVFSLVSFLFFFFFDDCFVSIIRILLSPALSKDGNLFESETFENCFQERLFVNGLGGNRRSESGCCFSNRGNFSTRLES